MQLEPIARKKDLISKYESALDSGFLNIAVQQKKVGEDEIISMSHTLFNEGLDEVAGGY